MKQPEPIRWQDWSKKANSSAGTCQIDYEQAVVLTNDVWKARARGVPRHCFLLATLFDPQNPAATDEAAHEAVLLRVTGAAPLPLEDKLTQAKVENLKQRATQVDGADPGATVNDDFRFSGLRCRVLGTFYTREGKLRLGSDIESYMSAVPSSVYRPTGVALEIVSSTT